MSGMPKSFRENDRVRTASGGEAVYRGGAWHVIANNPGELGMIKAMADGRLALPTSRAKNYQDIIQKLSIHDPQFDLANAGARVAVRRSFEAGKDHQNIVAMNTGIEHAGNLLNLIPALHNSDFPLWNSAKAAVSKAIGDPAYTNWEANAPAVANELNKVFTGGPGDAQGRKDFKDPLDESHSPRQLYGALKTYVGLLQGRKDALDDTYRKGMGTTKDITQFLSPEAQATWKRLQADPTVGNGQAAPAPRAGVAGDPARMSNADLMKALGQ